MGRFQLSPRQCAQLCGLVNRYKDRIQLRGARHKWTDDELWEKTLIQVVVAGGARVGATLEKSAIANQRVSRNRLKRIRGDKALKKELRLVMAAVRTRYVKDCRTTGDNVKVNCAVMNFRTLQESGGPRQFFSRVAKERTGEARIEFLKKHLKYYGQKAPGAPSLSLV